MVKLTDGQWNRFWCHFARPSDRSGGSPHRAAPAGSGNHAVGAEDQSAAAPPAALLFALHDGGPPTPGWCRNGVLAEVLPDLASKSNLHEVGKNGYDSDPLDADPTEPRVEIVTAHLRNRPMMRDEGRLGKYDRLWIVERCFAWIQQNRRILIRRNYYAEVSLGFVRSPLYASFSDHSTIELKCYSGNTRSN